MNRTYYIVSLFQPVLRSSILEDFEIIRVNDKGEVYRWLYENMLPYTNTNGVIQFFSDEDAIAFKLRWC